MQAVVTYTAAVHKCLAAQVCVHVLEATGFVMQHGTVGGVDLSAVIPSICLAQDCVPGPIVRHVRG
jgi:hypothetical protein